MQPAEDDLLERISRALWGEPDMYDGLVRLFASLREDTDTILKRLRDMESSRTEARARADRQLKWFVAIVPLFISIITALLTRWLA